MTDDAVLCCRGDGTDIGCEEMGEDVREEIG